MYNSGREQINEDLKALYVMAKLQRRPTEDDEQWFRTLAKEYVRNSFKFIRPSPQKGRSEEDEDY